MDSLILCKFLRGVFDDLFTESAEMLHAVTGWDVTADELRTVARRVVNARKLRRPTKREGWTRLEDTLPRPLPHRRPRDRTRPGPLLSPAGATLDSMIAAY